MVFIIKNLSYLIIIMKRLFLPYEERYETDFQINGIGIHELMPPGDVNRPNGTKDRLMMLFHDESIIYINGKKQLLPCNSLMLWDDKAGHHYGSLKPQWQHSWIHFYGHAAERYIEESKIISGRPFTLSEPDIFINYLERLYSEITLHKQPNITIMKNQFNSLLREIFRSIHHDQEIYIPQRIIKIKNLLERFPEKRYTLHDLSQSIAISIPRLCAEFKQHIGRSPIDYQISCRMERAAYLLSDRNLNINDVATRSGYSDIYQFSKAFKKYFGKSPSKYRSSGK
ncbi:MAG: helix-turn-helix transcriptional regulator [Victivallaceae bacterium]|nr:helix-turn-helix transcriptional regulator [Victivallaceae bacterium]